MTAELIETYIKAQSRVCVFQDVEVPLHLLRYVCMFCGKHGLSLMKDCFEFGAPDTLPFPIAHAFITIVSNVSPAPPDPTRVCRVFDPWPITCFSLSHRSEYGCTFPLWCSTSSLFALTLSGKKSVQLLTVCRNICIYFIKSILTDSLKDKRERIKVLLERAKNLHSVGLLGRASLTIATVATALLTWPWGSQTAERAGHVTRARPD